MQSPDQSECASCEALRPFLEVEREVSTSEIWGGEVFSDVFPTLTQDELQAIHRNLHETTN